MKNARPCPRLARPSSATGHVGRNSAALERRGGRPERPGPPRAPYAIAHSSIHLKPRNGPLYTRLSPDHFRVAVSTQAPALLMLSEIWDPGWTATVNGVPVAISQADWTSSRPSPSRPVSRRSTSATSRPGSRARSCRHCRHRHLARPDLRLALREGAPSPDPGRWQRIESPAVLMTLNGRY